MNESERIVHDAVAELWHQHGTHLTPQADALLLALQQVLAGLPMPDLEKLAADLASNRPLTDPA